MGIQGKKHILVLGFLLILLTTQVNSELFQEDHLHWGMNPKFRVMNTPEKTMGRSLLETELASYNTMMDVGGPPKGNSIDEDPESPDYTSTSYPATFSDVVIVNQDGISYPFIVEYDQPITVESL